MGKLVESNLLPVSQVISFTNSLVEENVKLLEVTPAIADGLQSGDVFVIRGEESDNSVLCSNNKTFEIKEAETSNSLMMLDKVILPADIEKKNSDSGRKLGWS